MYQTSHSYTGGFPCDLYVLNLSHTLSFTLEGSIAYRIPKRVSGEIVLMAYGIDFPVSFPGWNRIRVTEGRNRNTCSQL